MSAQRPFDDLRRAILIPQAGTSRYAVLRQSYDANKGTLEMATVRKTITLTDAQDDWIKAQVASGPSERRLDDIWAAAESRYRASND